MRMILTAALALAPLLANGGQPAQRLDEATAVLSEIMSAPDKGIPSDLLSKANCIVIVPALKKVAFVVGGHYGAGYLSCRNKNGSGWSAPGSVRIRGGSVGFQIGGSETDVVMLVMNAGGVEKLLSNKFTLGADASVAAGPVGRTAAAQTDLEMHAQILSWSRTQGVFAGIALQGASLEQDLKENQVMYHKTITNRQVVSDGTKVPEMAAGLIALLNKNSAREATAAGTN